MVDILDSCTADEVVAVVVAAVVVPLLHILPYRNVPAVEDIQQGIPDVVVVDKDCNYNNYCNHNQSVECYLFFLYDLKTDLDFVEGQWNLVASLAHHLKENLAANQHFLLQIGRQVYLHHDKYQSSSLKCPEKINKRI